MGCLPTVPPSSASPPLSKAPSSPRPPLIPHPHWHLSLFQFFIYFGYFVVLSIAYFLGAVLGNLWHFLRSHHQPLPLAQELRSPSEEKAAQVLSLQDGVLSNLQPEATTLAPEDGAWTAGPVLRDQSEAKA